MIIFIALSLLFGMRVVNSFFEMCMLAIIHAFAYQCGLHMFCGLNPIVYLLVHNFSTDFGDFPPPLIASRCSKMSPDLQKKFGDSHGKAGISVSPLCKQNTHRIQSHICVSFADFYFLCSKFMIISKIAIGI